MATINYYVNETSVAQLPNNCVNSSPKLYIDTYDTDKSLKRWQVRFNFEVNAKTSYSKFNGCNLEFDWYNNINGWNHKKIEDVPNIDDTKFSYIFDTGGYYVWEVKNIESTFYYNGLQRTVTFNPNGGTLNGNSKLTVTNFDTYQNVPSASKTNFEFNGWYITPTGGNYGPVWNGTPVELATDIILYANWKSTITYKKGYDNPDEVIQTQVITDYNSISIINLDRTYRQGYTLTSWNTQLNGGGTVYTPGETYQGSSGNITLYAQWKEQELPSKTFNVQYEPQNVSYTKSYNRTDKTLTLNFSKHEPYGTNGYFNCLKLECYDVIEQEDKTFEYDDEFYSNDVIVNISVNASGKLYCNGISTGITVPTENEFDLNIIACCKIGTQTKEGDSFKYTFDSNKPYIEKAELLFPTNTYLWSTTANICLNIKITNRGLDWGEQQDIQSVNLNVNGSDFLSLDYGDFGEYGSKRYKIILEDVDVTDLNNISIKLRDSVDQDGYSETSIPFSYSLINSSNIDKIENGEKILQSGVYDLINAFDDVVKHYDSFDEDETRQTLIEHIENVLDQIKNDGLICDGFNSESIGFYDLIKSFKDFYDSVKSQDSQYYCIDSQGNSITPLRKDNIEIIIPGETIQNCVLILTQGSVESNAIIDQIVNGNYLISSVQNNQDSRLIVANDISSPLPDNELEVFFNYLIAILYIIENIL